jgi:hypothetical protein
MGRFTDNSIIVLNDSYFAMFHYNCLTDCVTISILISLGGIRNISLRFLSYGHSLLQ